MIPWIYCNFDDKGNKFIVKVFRNKVEMNGVKKIKWLLMPILLLLMGCTETKKSSKMDSTQIEWVSDSVYNFGKIKEGETVVHYFSFRNIGEADFVIEKVETECGCVTIDYPEYPVKKGEEIKIGISFNSSGRYGKQYKEIRIFANISKRMQNIGFTADVR